MQELEKILEEVNRQINEYVDHDYVRGSGDVVKGLSIAKSIIRKHMDDGWIPVEKDLPKNESEVWVVLESTYGTGYRTYSSARYLYFENYGEGHWCDEHYGYLEWDKYSDGRGGSSQYKVIAWQSIAPYRPERSEIKLKPCPFCGVEAEVLDAYGGYTVKCRSCFCGTGIYKDSKRASEAWNRRADEQNE